MGSTSGAGGPCDCTCSTTYVNIDNRVKAIEKNEGIDVTPCTDAEGNWDPSPACTGFESAPQMSTGAFPECVVARTTIPIESCGKGAPGRTPDAGGGAPADAGAHSRRGRRSCRAPREHSPGRLRWRCRRSARCDRGPGQRPRRGERLRAARGGRCGLGARRGVAPRRRAALLRGRLRKLRGRRSRRPRRRARRRGRQRRLRGRRRRRLLGDGAWRFRPAASRAGCARAERCSAAQARDVAAEPTRPRRALRWPLELKWFWPILSP